MITAADLIRLPYTPDLTQAGVVYACRSLALGLVQADNLHVAPMRRLIAEVAAELALRRHLAGENISFDTRQTTPFTKTDWVEVVFGGRRCRLVDILITRRSILLRLRNNPSTLLQLPAYAPDLQRYSERLEQHDLLIFAFILALPHPGWQKIRQNQDTSLRSHYIYMMPKVWKNPAPGRKFAQLTLTNEGEGEIIMELGGRGVTGQFQQENLHCLARQTVSVVRQYIALAYLSTERIPAGQISLSSAGLHRPLLIPPHRWVDLWLNGIEIILAGYITVGDFHSKAQTQGSHGRSWDDYLLQSHVVSLPISELHPLPQLFDWIKSQVI